MAKPRRKLPKNAAETERLTGDEVIAAVFGKRAQEVLKEQAVTNADNPRKDYRIPGYYGGETGAETGGELTHDSI